MPVSVRGEVEYRFSLSTAVNSIMNVRAAGAGKASGQKPSNCCCPNLGNADLLGEF